MDDPRGTATARVGYLSEPGLAGLVLKNVLLTIVTLALYRFWARTRIRRYFWRNIVIGDEPLEYTGTGRELFVGFLIVVAILAPLGLLYAWLQRVTLGTQLLQGVLSLIYAVAVGGLIQAAIFRARRYRLSRTVWRGIRAGQGGSTWRYIGLSFAWALPVLLSLGLALPWATVALERYKINQTYFGQGRFSVEASGRMLFGRWLVAWGLLVVPMVVALGANLPSLAGGPGALPRHPGLFALIPLAVVAGFPAYAWFRVAVFRTLACRTRLGRIRLKSAASGGTVVGRMLLFGLIYLVLAAVAGGIAAAAGWQIAGNAGGGVAVPHFGWGAVALMGLAGLCLMGGSPVITYCWLWAPILQHLATTLEIENLDAADDLAQSTRPRQRFGEGLADSFELGGL